MSPARRFALSLAGAISALFVACGEPPDKEMQQAQGAIDAARAAGADTYAHDELTAAQDALKAASEAVRESDYRLALNQALSSREHAQEAARQAADHKATARSDAERALHDASAALGEVRLKLRTADPSRVPPKMLAEARRLIADGEQTVQKASAAFASGDYLGVTSAVRDTTGKLRALARDLDSAAGPGARRRR